MSDTYEQKHQRALARVDATLADVIGRIRYTGPPEPQMSEVHRSFLSGGFVGEMLIGRCLFCNPAPREWRCPACGQVAYEKWRMQVHNMADSELCRQMVAKKARRWSQHA